MAQSAATAMTTTVTSALRRILHGPHAVAALGGIALVIAAGIIAPGESPGIWIWVRLLVAACSAGIALAVIDVGRDAEPGAPTKTGQLLVAGVSLLVTILLSATFSTLTAIFGLVVIGLVLLRRYSHGPSSLALLWTLLGVLIPFWVWSAFDAWDRLLLLLIPLGLVGIISLEHALRADLYGSSGGSSRERYAAWVGVFGMAAALVVTGLSSSIATVWVAAGAALTVLLGVIDLMPARQNRTGSVPSITLPAVALLALMLTWMVAL